MFILCFHREGLSGESVVYGEANLPAKHLPVAVFVLRFFLPTENLLGLRFSFLPLNQYTDHLGANK